MLKKCLEKTFSNNFKSVLKGKVDGLKNKYIEILEFLVLKTHMKKKNVVIINVWFRKFFSHFEFAVFEYQRRNHKIFIPRKFLL